MTTTDRVAIVITAWALHMVSFCLALGNVIPWNTHWIGTVVVVAVIGMTILTDPDVRKR